ncbi:MAG: phosphoadenosine phosphosulfate reductase family protein [Desulfovibrionaceae bacterium]|nr:phosphoadenosine phosphosulfate reductase family protein [Desulfovibrionaceae bacterium]MBF0514890.1 phosphoadenosine phosphosulfate reductase family protein [Desulfovibrionaceae bacterium]
MTLSDKIAATKTALALALDRFGSRRTAVAWTGGKDSTAALHLYLEVLRDRGDPSRAVALSLDTGRKFAAAVAFRDRLAAAWDIDLRLVRPAPGAEQRADPSDKTACCRLLKIEPLRLALAEQAVACLITGIRADEHPDRASRPVFEERKNPDYTGVNAILPWTLLDVWAYVADRGLPYCELYDQGYTSLGCAPCTLKPEPGAPERDGRDPDKEALLPVLHSLGYF